MNIEKIKKIYELTCEVLKEAPAEEECSDIENEILDELANIKQILKDNMSSLKDDKKEFNPGYYELNDATEELLLAAVRKAIKKGDVVFFNNYQSYDREDGTPSRYEIDENDYEDYDDIDEVESIMDINSPEYDRDGCNDLVIHEKETDNYYYIWYSDYEENRVYVDEIKNYLEEE